MDFPTIYCVLAAITSLPFFSARAVSIGHRRARAGRTAEWIWTAVLGLAILFWAFGGFALYTVYPVQGLASSEKTVVEGLHALVLAVLLAVPLLAFGRFCYNMGRADQFRESAEFVKTV